MAERLKALLSKSSIPVTPGSWVRIPPSPPVAPREIDVCGEMSELAEGARLEIVCAVTSGTEGSNPSLSAINFFLLRLYFLNRILASKGHSRM